MLTNTNNDWAAMNDNAIISVIGLYIKQQRLEQDKTQAQLAKEAGLNRWTIGQIENGESITLASLIQILRVLDMLHILKIFSFEEKISPIEYAKLKEKMRKRATSTISVNLDEGDIDW